MQGIKYHFGYTKQGPEHMRSRMYTTDLVCEKDGT